MTAELQIDSGGKRIEARRFLRFVALGGCAAAVNWLSRFPLGVVLPFSMAVVAAYLVGMAVAFVLFSRFVFPSSPRPLAEQVKFFVAVNIAGVAQVWLVSIALAHHLFPMIGFVGPLAEPVAHGIAIGVPTISSYFGHRFLTFRS
jgi:putative flippase GtrA